VNAAARSNDSVPGRNGSAGFTLIEVLVAVTLLGTVLIGLAATANMGAREIQRSKQLSIATIVGREVVDRVIALPFDSTPVGTNMLEVTSGKSTYYVATTVAQRAGFDDLRDVTVSVVTPGGRELRRYNVSIQPEWGSK
jgi:prepilin-type N-terminal cleavage/methylation domain-containing protein